MRVKLTVGLLFTLVDFCQSYMSSIVTFLHALSSSALSCTKLGTLYCKSDQILHCRTILEFLKEFCCISPYYTG